MDAGMAPCVEPNSLAATVDQRVPSGYIGDGSSGGVTDVACMERAGSARGKCHEFIWTKGPNTRGWAGVMWQYPEGNFNDPDQGFPVPAGARTVQFYAWGAQGGEVVTFSAGNAVDSFSVELSNVVLSAERRSMS